MAGPRLTNAQRARAFGPRCAIGSYAVVSLWGNRVIAHPAVAHLLVVTAEEAHRALNRVGAQHTVPRRMDSYNCRAIAGSASPSLHSWALAWDIFRTAPGIPPPGGVYTPDAALHPVFVQVFEAAGFTWGGRFRRPDQPHFEWASAPPR